MPIAWSQVFQTSHPEPGADEGEVLALADSISRPLSEEEIASINGAQVNPFRPSNPLARFYRPYDCREWELPARPLPPAYLDFLRWSNGGSFFNEDRAFDPMFSASKVREYLLGYEMPHYMPGVVPFAFDGGGTFYLFDMRQEAIDGEYPILFKHAGNLGYGDAVLVGDSFLDVCRGTADPWYR
jgi:hypothetical protein